jgi:hypothetical protein
MPNSVRKTGMWRCSRSSWRVSHESRPIVTSSASGGMKNGPDFVVYGWSKRARRGERLDDGRVETAVDYPPRLVVALVGGGRAAHARRGDLARTRCCCSG